MASPRPPLTLLAGALVTLILGGCGAAPEEDAGDANTLGFDPMNIEVPEFAPRAQPGGAAGPTANSEPEVPPLTLAAGPDVCFREVAKAFGPDVKVAEITSFFSAGEAISGRSSEPRGQMTTCAVTFQSPSDPRKLLGASYNSRTGSFGPPAPVEITVMGGNAASFRLSDHLVPLSRINPAALAGVMDAQERRLRSLYSDFAWSGVRLEGPDAFSRTHTLRLDLEGRIAANDVKGSGYASVSLDGKRITADYLRP